MTEPVFVKTGQDIYLVKDRDNGELVGEVERYSGRWHAYPTSSFPGEQPRARCQAGTSLDRGEYKTGRMPA